MKRAIALLLGLMMSGTAPAAETFGRLFFTPTQRAQLDLARAQNRVPQVTAEPAEAAPAPEVLRYSGMVRRSDGKSVLWLNNRPVDEKEALSSLAVTGRVHSDGAVTVRVPQAGRSVDLKVGQSIELQSGKVAEAYLRSPVAAPKDPSTTATSPESAPVEKPSQPAATPGSSMKKESQPAAGSGLRLDRGEKTEEAPAWRLRAEPK